MSVVVRDIKALGRKLGLTYDVDYEVVVGRLEHIYGTTSHPRSIEVLGRGWQETSMGELTSAAEAFCDYLMQNEGKGEWEFLDADRGGVYYMNRGYWVRFA